MEKLTVITWMIIGVLAGGCNKAAKESPKVASDPVPTNAIQKEESSKVDFVGASASVLIERMLVKTGQLEMKVVSIEQSRLEIQKLAKGVGAYLGTEDQSADGGRINYSAVIRVPSAGFDELIRKIEALGSKLESKSVTSEDVTAEFVDVEARLKTKRDLSERYHEILKNAKTISDVLAVETQIGNVQTEIESMEGRLKFLRDQVSLSTLTVRMYESTGVDFGFGSKLVKGFRGGWDGLLSFVVVIAYLWPLAILLGMVYWIYQRMNRKKPDWPSKE
jgi:Domain of unknown function (DUF4349)